MYNFQKIKQNFKNLPTLKKLVLFSSGFMIISVFLPWYKDINRFNVGDTFLGITGPLYLAGILVLIFGIISFGIVFKKISTKESVQLSFKESYLHIITSGLSILMLILSASVYFHPKFGINLTNKSMGIGMIFAFISGSILLFTAILSSKAKKEVDISDDVEENLNTSDPALININKDRTPQKLDSEKEDTNVDNITHNVNNSIKEPAPQNSLRGFGYTDPSKNINGKDDQELKF